jgi:hypothetical protein
MRLLVMIFLILIFAARIVADSRCFTCAAIRMATVSSPRTNYK